MRQILVMLLFVISFGLGAVDNLLKRPESVVYSDKLDAFLISNKSGGAIVKMTPEGEASIFNQDLISVRGIVLVDSILYCAAEGGVFGISINTAKLKVQIPIPDAQFFNDIAWDGGNYLFVSDTDVGRIIRIDIETRFNTILVGMNLKNPNGIYYDSDKSRLIVVSMVEKSPIYEVNPLTGKMKVLIKTKLSNLDGITRDANGYWYISSWKTGTVYVFDKNLKGKPQKFITHQKGPADIYYHAKENAIAVPNFNGNILKFAGVRESYQF
ncbi:MAG: SMP-30/gluconolactonase/LRE family protein [Candidatus Cloacimonetes bacterium]|nr:SMP-30/gluconolactonase/LRE family protein [Candidatus Cloacimonadota bacterium]